MLSRENTYFEDLYKISNQYREKCNELKEKHSHAVDEFGWGSKEVAACCEEQEALINPVSAGMCKAYQAWSRSVEDGVDELEMREFLWEREVSDFVQTLKNAKVQTFVYTNQSTAVMENLHELVEAGCKMEGLCTIKKTKYRFGRNEEEQIPGVRFSIQ